MPKTLRTPTPTCVRAHVSVWNIKATHRRKIKVGRGRKIKTIVH